MKVQHAYTTTPSQNLLQVLIQKSFARLEMMTIIRFLFLAFYVIQLVNAASHICGWVHDDSKGVTRLQCLPNVSRFFHSIFFPVRGSQTGSMSEVVVFKYCSGRFLFYWSGHVTNIFVILDLPYRDRIPAPFLPPIWLF